MSWLDFGMWDKLLSKKREIDPPPRSRTAVLCGVSRRRKRSALSAFHEQRHWQTLKCLVNTRNNLGNRKTPEVRPHRQNKKNGRLLRLRQINRLTEKATKSWFVAKLSLIHI